jgi:hypothetical protein
MSHFQRSKLFDAHLPSAYKPLIEALELFARTRHDVKDESQADRRAALGPIHDRIVTDSLRLLPPDHAALPPRDAELGFAMGALLCGWYHASAVGDCVVDTFGSATLAAYRADFIDSDGALQTMREAVVGAFSLTSEELAELDRRLSAEQVQVDRRERIIAALDEHYGFRVKTGEALDNAAFEMLTDFYGTAELNVDDVSMIRTGLSLFFFIETHEAGQAFLDRALAWKHVQFRHFPVFGSFRGEQVDELLRKRWAAHAGLSLETIDEVLCQMVTVFKRHEVEKYLVHDVWGHQWQSLLLPFEEDFAEMAKSLRLPPLEASFAGLDGSTVTLGETMASAIEIVSAGGPLDEALFDDWIFAVAAERIRRSVTGMTAELLADICEYKFQIQNPDLGHLMPSSSAFADRPTKLDLSFMDLEFFFPVGLRALQRVDEAANAVNWLVGTLKSTLPDAPHGAIDQAVQALESRISALNETMLATHFESNPTARGLEANLYTRTALNMAGLHAALLTTYDRLHAESRKYPAPLGDFRDLLALSVGAFYQADPSRHFWHLDEFIGLHFRPCLERLVAALPLD